MTNRASTARLLDVVDLGVSFGEAPNEQPVLCDVSFTLGRGESLGIVGESGSGKSMTARAIAGLLPPGGRVNSGSIFFDGLDVVAMPQAERRQLLGTRIGMIFQDPLGSLNPVIRVGDQIAEGLRVRQGLSKREARIRVLELMDAVRIPVPHENYAAYPHEFSGGMRQRVMIAVALSMNPVLVIADEPTTALDVTVAAQVLDLLRELCREHGVALILISHDVRTVERTTQRMVVMYAGRIVESGPTVDISLDPSHPYTRGLLASVPPHDRRLHRLRTIEGFARSSGPTVASCAFAPRCESTIGMCTNRTPDLLRIGESNRRVSCFAVQGETDDSG